MKSLFPVGWLGCWALMFGHLMALGGASADTLSVRGPVGVVDHRLVAPAFGVDQPDFLGLRWQVVGDHAGAGPALALTTAGERLGLPKPNFAQPLSTYPRVYDLVPVAPRVERNGGGAAGRISCQVTLTDTADWELAEATGAATAVPGDLTGLSWTKVRLPATVQYALFCAGKTPNPWFADNYKQLQPLHRKDWYLRRTFRTPDDWTGRAVRLRFDGLDYSAAVWLDGQVLGLHEGMAGGPTFDLTGRLKPGCDHTLLVRLIHEQSIQDMPLAAAKGDVIKSMAVDGASYQWGNRFRSIGVWQPVRLVVTGQAYLEAPVVRTEQIADGAARLSAQAMVTNVGSALSGIVEARIVDLTSGRVVWQDRVAQAIPAGISFWERSIRLERPNLWWPNGLGPQSLYRLELSLRVPAHEMDTISTRFGIRTLELRRNPAPPDSPRAESTAWHSDDPLDMDMMRRADESFRFLFVVNGRPFYAKGACWLTSDDLLVLSPQRQQWMIDSARASHINLFRLNGGCNLFETDEFFDLCDERGILVWQELPLCWNSGHAASRSVWRDQLTQTTLRLRQHPSMALYVGGNEFQPYLAGIAPVLGLAREIFNSYDERPFRMASPGGGTHHAYLHLFDLYTGDPNWYERIYHRGYHFVSEWSFPAIGNMSLLRRVVPEDELNRGPVGYDWKQFVDKHPILKDRHSEVDFIGRYSFDKASWYADLAKAGVAELSEASQMAQVEVYGTTMEQWRAHFPYKGGQTVWTYNTMGPVSSWNLIDWFGQPTAAFYAAQRAHEPLHVMLRTDSYSWAPGDTMRVFVFALCDAPQGLASGQIRARVFDRQLTPVADRSWDVRLAGGGVKNDEHPLAWQIPSDTPESYFFVELTLSDAAGARGSRQAYWMRTVKSLADPAFRKRWQSGPVADPVCTKGPWLKPQLAGLPTRLEAKLLSAKSCGDGEAELSVAIENRGDRPAFAVRTTVQPARLAVRFSDDVFWLAEGERKVVTGRVRLDMTGLDPVTPQGPAKLAGLVVGASAWNAIPVQAAPAGGL
ncbi:MAG: glycoside hydrolase family 2 protein [Thermoguttaceae bacterium]